MNLRLLRADPAYQMAKVSALAGLATTYFSYLALDGRKFALERVALLLLGILTLAGSAILQPRRRTWPFQVALPVRASELARVRLLAIVLCWSAPVLAIAGVAALVRPDLRLDALTFTLSGVGCALASAALHVGLYPGRAILPRRGLGFACLVLSTVVVLYVRQRVSPGLALVPLALGLLAVAWASWRLPERFTREDVLAAAARPTAVDLGHYFTLALGRTRSTPSIARLVRGRWLRSPALWFELLMAFTVGASFFARPLMSISFAIVAGFFPMRILLMSLKDLAHLPISRAFYFRRLVCVGVAFLVLAAAIVTLAPRVEDGAPHGSGGEARSAHLEFDPAIHAAPAPYGDYRLALGSHAPALVAPNGEAHSPDLIPLFGFLPIGLYDPYSSSVTSSRAFVAWQRARIVADERELWLQQGRAWTPAELVDRTAPLVSADEWMRTAPDVRGGSITAARMLLLVCMWGLGFWLGMPCVAERRSALFTSLMWLPFVLFVPLVMIANMGIETWRSSHPGLAAWIGYLQFGLPHQLALWLPESTLLGVAIVLVAFLAFVRLAWRRFRTAEMPTSFSIVSSA